MKTLFIPAKSKFEVSKSKILEISKVFPRKIAVVYSVQYEIQAKEIKKLLEKTHRIDYFQQILGCSKPQFKNVDAILLIGDGKFHAISLAFESNLPVYIYNRNELEKISSKEIELAEKKQKGAYVNFLHANKIGVLISAKQGQQNLVKALELKKNLKNKSVYLFVDNNINISEFENFPEIKSWVNTACPRLDMNSNKIINSSQIKP